MNWKRYISGTLIIVTFVACTCLVWNACRDKNEVVVPTTIQGQSALGRIAQYPLIPDSFKSNQPDIILLLHTSPQAQANGIYGLLDGYNGSGEWIMFWQDIDSLSELHRVYGIPVGHRRLVVFQCIYYNGAIRKKGVDSTKYDLVIDRNKGTIEDSTHPNEVSFEGMLNARITDTLGNVVVQGYKEVFGFSSTQYDAVYSQVDYTAINRNWMAIPWHTIDIYTFYADITGLNGAFNFVSTVNSGNIFPEQKPQGSKNNTAIYPMWIDSAGVHLRH